MNDREKVIKGLEAMREFFGFGLPSQSPVFKSYQNILTDAIALLEVQDAVEPEWYDETPFCGNCGHRLEKKNRNMEIKCPTCGRSVKWE